jgi:hypothetical protein
MILELLRRGIRTQRIAGFGLAILQIALSGIALADEPPCRQAPRVVEQCFTVHGRISVHPNMRPYLWPFGTRRMLGIASPDGAIIMPPELKAIFKDRIVNQAIGDFEVCPFTRRRAGVMQLVCVEAAKHLIVREGRE